MRAAFIDGLGGPDAIRYGTVPMPSLGPDEVLVEVAATPVNAVDTFVRSGAYRTPMSFPFVIGRDLVGTVSAVGPHVDAVVPGQWVWSNSLGHGGRQGAAAEYAVVPADRLYLLPAGVDPIAMSALVHPAATAYLALIVHGRLRARETVVVIGAAGHVGRAATVVARGEGARVVAVARGADLASCRRLGAAVAIDRDDPELVSKLRDASPEGVDVHLDTSGHHDLDAAAACMAPRGRIVLMAGLATRPALPVGPVYTRDLTIAGFAISNADVAELAAAAARINELAADGVLVPAAVRELPLSEASRAHRLIGTGQSRGVRIVLRP